MVVIYFWSAAGHVVRKTSYRVEATGPLGQSFCGVMSRRSVRSSAGDAVPLDARLGSN